MADPQGFPQVSWRLTDESGNITQAWYQLLLALWRRTGGGQGQGFVVEVDTGAGLTGGPINGANPSGTIALAPIANNTLLANITPFPLAPQGVTLSDLLDAVFGTSQGQIIFRDSLNWTTLAPGSDGQFLEVMASTPEWATLPPSAELLPLSNGDTPGVALIGDTVGQCIGVPI